MKRKVDLNFQSLHCAVNDVRKHNGIDRKPDRPVQALEPLRSRHSAFRWRVIPAIYCAFYAAMFFGGRTYQLIANAQSTARLTWIVTGYLIAMLLGVAAIAWMRNQWLIAMFFMIAATVAQPLFIF